MATKDLTLFESAMRGMRVSKHGRVMQLIADGNGACVVQDIEYNAAYKWACSKSSGGSAASDRGKFLDQITTLIARPGSFVNTRGNDKPIEDIARFMQSSGFDLNDWGLPPSVKALFMKGPKPQAKPKAAGDTSTAEPPAEDSAADQ